MTPFTKLKADIKYDEETGDQYIELGQELCDELGWQVDDTIEWINNGDGSFTLRKKEDA